MRRYGDLKQFARGFSQCDSDRIQRVPLTDRLPQIDALIDHFGLLRDAVSDGYAQ